MRGNFLLYYENEKRKKLKVGLPPPHIQCFNIRILKFEIMGGVTQGMKEKNARGGESRAEFTEQVIME